MKYQHGRIQYSDRDLFIVPEFTYSFVENYIRNKASGDAYLGKGYTYFSELHFWHKRYVKFIVLLLFYY